jgi:lipopolysaccharide biosynthesis protein
VLKLHGKRSTHREDGDAWRRELLDKLLAPARAARILSAFAEDPRLGIVHAEGHLQPLHYYWGENEANVDYVCRLAGIPAPDVEHDSFVAGSMFWLRPDALRLLLDAHLGLLDFESEAAQLDGTLAHALERSFSLCASAGNFVTRSAVSLMGGADGKAGPYRYAERSH